jgi:hypothetical protein
MQHEKRSAHTVLIRKPQGKRPHGSYKCRWEDNIKQIVEVGCE